MLASLAVLAVSPGQIAATLDVGVHGGVGPPVQKVNVTESITVPVSITNTPIAANITDSIVLRTTITDIATSTPLPVAIAGRIERVFYQGTWTKACSGQVTPSTFTVPTGKTLLITDLIPLTVGSYERTKVVFPGGFVYVGSGQPDGSYLPVSLRTPIQVESGATVTLTEGRPPAGCPAEVSAAFSGYYEAAE
jgi:hypothetical protein